MPSLTDQLADLLDIAVVALLLWALIAWARRVRAHLALIGLGLLVAFYFAAVQLQLRLTAWLFQGFFAILVIVLVVVFQQDLRRLFEQIAVVGLRRRPPAPEAACAAAIHRALLKLAGRRWGALVVVAGREPVERHVRGGARLDGQVSEELLLSLFDPHSPGHDGAVLVQGDRVARFGIHLPLSQDQAQLAGTGTRHAAALGLSERTDALCLVVSEERGTVAVARRGQLQVLPEPAQLLEALQPMEAQWAATHRGRQRWQRLRRRLLEGGTASAVAVASWLAFVPGSAPDQITLPVQVVVDNLPYGCRLDAVKPTSVEVTLAGPRRDVLVAQAAPLEAGVTIDTVLFDLGRRTFPVLPSAVRGAEGLTVVRIEPAQVVLSVTRGSR